MRVIRSALHVTQCFHVKQADISGEKGIELSHKKRTVRHKATDVSCVKALETFPDVRGRMSSLDLTWGALGVGSTKALAATANREKIAAVFMVRNIGCVLKKRQEK